MIIVPANIDCATLS